MREVYSRREVIVASLLGLAIAASVWGPVLLRPFATTQPSGRHAPHPSVSPRAAHARPSMSLGRGGKAKPAKPVNINRADALALQTLPGIGPTLATRIVMHRKAHGPFQEPDGLLEVEGIGLKRFETIKPWIVAY